MSNARDIAQLINKVSPTATGVDLTGTLSATGNLEATGNLDIDGTSDLTGNITLGATGEIIGGRSWSRIVDIQEATNSSPVSSSSSSLTMDDHTFTLKSEHVKSDGTANIEVEIYGNARYVEDSDDPSFRPQIQFYNYATSTWAGITDTDNYFQNRHADRGSSNYHRGGYALWTTIVGISTANYLSSSNQVRVRLSLIGGGGTSGDDLDNYYVYWKLTTWARG